MPQFSKGQRILANLRTDPYWYPGTIRDITAQPQYRVVLDDNDIYSMPLPFTEDEIMEYTLSKGSVVYIKNNGSYKNSIKATVAEDVKDADFIYVIVDGNKQKISSKDFRIK